MPVLMTTLKRAKNGDWFSRKAIPSDVRGPYRLAYGIGREERFRVSGAVRADQAKQQFRDWDAEITGRFHALRAAARGEGATLTHRQRHETAARWYAWATEKWLRDPGEPEDWDDRYEQLQGVYDRFDPRWDEGEEWNPGPFVRRQVRAKVIELGEVRSFLAEAELNLTQEAEEQVIDTIEDELIAAFALLRKRSSGDYTADAHVRKHKELLSNPTEGGKLARLNCWELFEAWVKERRPAASTINRWRAVFIEMDREFTGRDVATITDDEAIAWKGKLVTEDRSPRVVNDVWLNAASTVFKWALTNKKIKSNPFAGVKVATPRKARKTREREFADDEWKTILSASLQPSTTGLSAHHAAARRWVPWVCAYTGARPGEVTQLRSEDVYQHSDGTWLMRITPEAGTVKGFSAREVPLHEHLIEQGFADFTTRASGPLFYDPAMKRKKSEDPTNPSQPLPVKVRNRLAQWVRELGVTDKNISPNHAWRHTFKRRCARVGIEKRIRFGMCGHSSDDVGDEYETPTLQDLIVEMRKFPRYAVDGS